MAVSVARYGEIPGYPVGTAFPKRADAHTAGVHRQLQAGICGTKELGAESIVVSGGYEDDVDLGGEIIYTGHGGQDDSRKRQVADQTFDRTGNAALLTSSISGIPVRVLRGAHAGSPFAPSSGYRYDGLFRVTAAWLERGRSGYQVCRFRLVKEEPEVILTSPDRAKQPERRTSTVQRVVRSTPVSEHIKRLYDHTCQACRTRLTIAGRGYSEGAHIRPLGRPHNGPDVTANVLCLCPNCHVLFDKGALIIDNWQVWVNSERGALLATDENHPIGNEYLRYHRDLYRF